MSLGRNGVVRNLGNLCLSGHGPTFCIDGVVVLELGLNYFETSQVCCQFDSGGEEYTGPQSPFQIRRLLSHEFCLSLKVSGFFTFVFL